MKPKRRKTAKSHWSFDEAKANPPKRKLRKDQHQQELTGSTFTFDEWSEKGYRISKGAKSRSRNLDGKPLFGADQVWKPDKSFVPAPSKTNWSKPSGLVEEVKERIARKAQAEEALHSFMDPDFDVDAANADDSIPFFHREDAPNNAFDNGGFPTKERMDYHASMLDSNHEAIRQLGAHLDSVFEKHHGGTMEPDDDDPPW